MYVIQRTRTNNAGKPYVEFLTQPNNGLTAFRRPGTSRIGVGVDNLMTWKTTAGPERWMAARTGWREQVSKAGPVEVVPL